MKVNVSITKKERKYCAYFLMALMIIGVIGLLISPFGTWKEKLLNGVFNALCLLLIIGAYQLGFCLDKVPTIVKDKKNKL